MLAMRLEWINQFISLLRHSLPSRFSIEAWSIEPDAKLWRCEIRVGRDLYWGEFKISEIATPHALEALVRGIKGHMPRVRCST